MDNRFDTALLLSADSDLSPPILEILSRWTSKKVVVAFPPERFSSELQQHATASFQIGAAKVRQAQFPDQIQISRFTTLTKPDRWCANSRQAPRERCPSDASWLHPTACCHVEDISGTGVPGHTPIRFGSRTGNAGSSYFRGLGYAYAMSNRIVTPAEFAAIASHYDI